jgi:hypothetical protein
VGVLEYCAKSEKHPPWGIGDAEGAAESVWCAFRPSRTRHEHGRIAGQRSCLVDLPELALSKPRKVAIYRWFKSVQIQSVKSREPSPALIFKQHDEYDGKYKEFEESKEFKEFKEVAVTTTCTLPAIFCCRLLLFLSYNFLHARWLHACK